MMADSDAENEKFVENVMHALQAFHITDKPKTSDLQDHVQVAYSNPADNANGEGQSEFEKLDNPGKPPPTDIKAPTRIIKFSRPSSQFSSSRAQANDQSEPNSSSTQGSSCNVNGVSSSSTLASAVSGTPAPGSRLAALQRPGSPFHKYLQRAQSPALAAAAKLTNPTNLPSANATADSADNVHEGKNEVEAQGANGEIVENDNVATENKTDVSSNQTQSRSSTVPPRIQRSALTSSILLRRPQSPLHGARNSNIPINRQVAGVAAENVEPADPGSPKSPKSDGPASPALTAAKSITSADKVAIRNKLRANSFRLKDLLEKRPYGKSKDQEDETKDDSATVTHRLGHSERSASLDNSNDGDCKTDKPRVSAVLLRSRSRASGERPPPTLISARSLRTRSAEVSLSTNLKEQNVDETTDTNVNKERNSTSSLDIKAGHAQSSVVRTSQDQEEINSVPNTSGGENQRITEKKVTVGASLLRSPRSKIQTSESLVPSGQNSSSQRHDISKEGHSFSRNIKNVPEDPTDSPKMSQTNEETTMHNKNTNTSNSQNYNDASDIKSKAILDLEKEKEVNLVFDSEAVGQTEQNHVSTDQIQSHSKEGIPDSVNSNTGNAKFDTDKSDLKEIQEARKSARESFLSQSMTTSTTSTPRWRDWKRQRSEPGSTITDTAKDTDKHHLSVDDGKAEETTANVEFSRASPAMKRSLAVTDLDKAMIDRDQQKLSSMFREGSHDTIEKGKETETKGASPKDVETDLDARRGRVSKIQEKMSKSVEEKPLSPTSLPTRSEPVYKPSVNMEDAVKWPLAMPGKLDFRQMEVFEGQMLLNWLTGSIDKSHYLRLVVTKHDISVIACQMCTGLLAAGVIKQLESKDVETVFKPDCMYYWTHTQTNISEKAVQDVNKLPPMWPPNLTDSPEKPGLKYTEADHQAAMVTLRHEYKDEVEKIQIENQGVLDKARKEYETRLQKAIERIAHLQEEVQKYKCLAGIEKLTQAALSDADAARIEAGLQSDETQSNGYSSPSSGTPSISQYHTPAVTPDCLSVDIPMNIEKSPNELFNDITTPNELRPGDGVPAAPPAPPAPPPYPGSVPPPPPPAPPPFNALHRKASLKPVVNPKSPMKPLFWQRIQVHEVKTPKHKEYVDSKLVWEDIKEEEINIDELDELFSKTAMITSRRFSPNKPKAKAQEVAKIIIPKRSQTIGILLSSLRLEMSEIEDAILKFDTSQLSEEKLRQIYENKGSDDEIKKIKEHMKKHPDIPLDKPDQFLYDLSLIPDYAERIFCFIFQQAFQESISVIESKMTNLRMTCRNLMSSVNIRRLLGLVLALGNYMNGGNKSRGQADGFGLEILPKLKDVKSKDNMSSLLHYTVYQYIKRFEKNDAGTEKVSLPLPDPSDMSQAKGVNFDELGKELVRIKKDFEAAEERAAKVIQSAKEEYYLQPFKDTMTTFFEKGRQEFRDQEDNLAEGKKIFQETVIFFCVKPKSGEKVVTPDYFFSLWAQFCQDFKTIWKREQQKLLKQRLKENEQRVKKIQEKLAKKPVRTRERKAGGLKDRLAKQGLLDT